LPRAGSASVEPQALPAVYEAAMRVRELRRRQPAAAFIVTVRRMDVQCRCEGLRQVVRQQLGDLRGEEMREMMECARNLPNQCCLSPQRCEIRSAWF